MKYPFIAVQWKRILGLRNNVMWDLAILKVAILFVFSPLDSHLSSHSLDNYVYFRKVPEYTVLNGMPLYACINSVFFTACAFFESA